MDLKQKLKRIPACCVVHSNRDEYAAQVNATLTLTPSSPLPTSTITSSLVPQSSLSGGAIAGITLGCLAFVAALVAAFYFWCKRRRKRKRNTVRSVNSKARSPISPRSPWRYLGRSETMKTQGGGGGGGGGGGAKVDLDLDLVSGVPELLSGGGGGGGGGRDREGSAAAAAGGGRKGFGSVLANVRRLTPPRRPPNPQSSNLNFDLVESNSTSTHTQHTQSQTHPHAQFQLRHPYAYPLPQHTQHITTPTFATTDVPPLAPVPLHPHNTHTHVQPPSPTERDENRLSRASSSAFKWIKSTVQKFTPTSPRAPNLPPTSTSLSSPRLQHQPRPMVDLLSSTDPTSPHDLRTNTNTDAYTYMQERNRMSERTRKLVLRTPAVDPNRPPSPRADSDPMELSTANDLALIGGVAGSAPLREDVLQGAWVGEGGALFISRESLERREKERRRWRDDGPILLPSDNESVDDDDKEDRALREVMERSRIDAEGWGAARVGYVPAQTRPPPQASGSGLSHSHLYPTTMGKQSEPEQQPLQQQQQQSTRSQLPEFQFSPSPLLIPGIMPGSVFPSHTSLLNPPHPPTRSPQVASTSGQVQLQPPQPPPRLLPQGHQPELYPTIMTTVTTDTSPQADLPEIQVHIPPLEAVSTGSPISPSLLAPSGLSPTSLEWISPPESFTEHPDVPVSVYSGNGEGRRRSKRRSKGGVWQVTSPIDAPASSMPFGVIVGSGGEGLATQSGMDSTTTGLKRTATHPPRISKPQGARAKDALPSSITKRMFAKVGVGLGPSGGGGGAPAVGKQPQMQPVRSMSADNASGTGTGNGKVAGSSGSLHPSFAAPGQPPPLVIRPSSASNMMQSSQQRLFPIPALASASAVRPIVHQQPSVSAPSLILARHPLPPLPFGMPPRPVLSPIPDSPLPLSQLAPSAPQSPPTRGPRPRPASPPLPQGPQARDSRFSMLSLLQAPSGHSHAQSQSQSQSNVSQVLSSPPEEERQFASPIGPPDPAQSATYAMPSMRLDSTDSVRSTGTGRGVRRLPPIPGEGQPPA